jgi:hypothetical protein
VNELAASAVLVGDAVVKVEVAGGAVAAVEGGEQREGVVGHVGGGAPQPELVGDDGAAALEHGHRGHRDVREGVGGAAVEAAHGLDVVPELAGAREVYLSHMSPISNS